jgi:hypothetical protein
LGALHEMTASLLGEAGNPAFGCYVTGYRALAADATGMNRNAVDYAQAALGQSTGACSALARSWLAAIGANVVASSGDGGLALNLLGQARNHFAASSGKEDWMYDFDYSALAVYRGQCHLRLGLPREAIEVFTAGLAEMPPDWYRRQAESLDEQVRGHLATLT